MRARALSVACLCLSMPTIAMTQAFKSGGTTFTTNTDRGPNFRSVPKRPCTFFGVNLSVCKRDTAWTLESEVLEGPIRHALYQLDAQHRGAVRVVVMDFGKALALSPPEVQSLFQTHVMDDAARGQRRLKIVLSNAVRHDGALRAQTSVLEAENGQISVQNVTVFRLQYGLAFVETIRDVDSVVIEEDTLKEASAVHTGLLNIIRIRLKIGPGYRK